MRDENHSFLHHAIDVLQYVWILVGVETQIVPANTSVFRSRELLEAFPAKDIVLHASHIADVDAGFEEALGCLLSFMEDLKRTPLIRVGVAQYEGPANLRVVSINLRRQFGYQVIAPFEPALVRRPHSENLGAAGGDQHEVIFCTIRFEECFDFGNQFVLRHSNLRRVREMPVAEVCKAGCLFEDFDFLGSFHAAKFFDGCRGGYGFVEGVGELRFHEFQAGDGDSARSETLQAFSKIGAPGEARAGVPCQKLVIPWMRQQDRQLAGFRENGNGMRAEEIEIHQRAEKVLSPAMPVEQQAIPAGFRYQIQKLFTSLLIDHSGYGCSPPWKGGVAAPSRKSSPSEAAQTAWSLTRNVSPN